MATTLRTLPKHPSTCPHVEQGWLQPVPSRGIQIPACCKHCKHFGNSNYVCLTCYEVFCDGNGGPKHMFRHTSDTRHPVGLNLFQVHVIKCFYCPADLSLPEQGIMRQAHEAAFYSRFGKAEELPSLEDDDED